MAFLLSNATHIEEDGAFGIIRRAKADKHPNSVMLSAGVYRDEKCEPWTLPVVTMAKDQLSKDCSLNHDYLPISGEPRFLRGARRVALGVRHCADTRISSVQTVAGTGANHIGALLTAEIMDSKQVWFSDPTWVNHPLIWAKAARQITQRSYPYWSATTNKFDFDGMMTMLETESRPGDIVVLQACAHNPTGIDPSKEQWKAIAELCRRRRLFPFFDSAYQGFASGDLDEDGWALQHFLDYDDIELCIAQSFSKNFGLYSERVGALHVKTGSAETGVRVQSMLEQILRSEMTTPPAFGARLVAQVLDDKVLYAQWMKDLRSMSSRMYDMRQALYAELLQFQPSRDWDYILKQDKEKLITCKIGMFSYIGITPHQATILADRYHIYLLHTGRISITGLTLGNVKYIAQSISEVIGSTSITKH
ncbi:putative aspartate transaminase [Aureobasidium sp. EXF-10728]|nr:putative aspartate transaminase [Aureobasidium sp. EXF-10728]